jgi:glyoxalase family protein
MLNHLTGIHHITAIAGDPQRNLSFYTGLLGLRLVKVTVRFDEPHTYHLFYGDGTGQPGSLLTFYARPGVERGRKGPGQATIASLAVPIESLQYWAERLEDHRLPYEGPIARFSDRLLTFFDPDDLQIELVGQRGLRDQAARYGPVPGEYCIRRICGATLALEEPAPIDALLSALGWRAAEDVGNRHRYVAGPPQPGGESFLDVLLVPGMIPGQIAAGNIHHLALTTADERSQQAWREVVRGQGLAVSPVQDEQYFRSFYFREPGGVLFEIVTAGPGLTTDEPAGKLGSRLMLPAWLEPQRAAIEQALPPVQLPAPLTSI